MSGLTREFLCNGVRLSECACVWGEGEGREGGSTVARRGSVCRVGGASESALLSTARSARKAVWTRSERTQRRTSLAPAARP